MPDLLLFAHIAIGVGFIVSYVATGKIDHLIVTLGFFVLAGIYGLDNDINALRDQIDQLTNTAPSAGGAIE